MKCQYCGKELNDGVHFCNNCGQTVDIINDTHKNTDAFWTRENNQKKREIVERIEAVQRKCERIQEELFHGRKLNYRKNFFRVMLVLLILCICVLIYDMYKIYGNMNEHFSDLCIAAMFTIIVHFLIIAVAVIVIKHGPIGLLYLLIPIFGNYYLLYSVICGIVRLFVPLKKDEVIIMKDFKRKTVEMKVLKETEKDLKAGLELIDKGIMVTLGLKQNKTIVTKQKGVDGWLITTVLAIIILVVAFAISYYFAPIIRNNIL